MTASLPHKCFRFNGSQSKTPGGFPPRVPCQVVTPSSEVALSAEQHGDAVLVLQLIKGRRLGKRGSRGDKDSTIVLLVQTRPVDVGGEGEVLDRGPDDVATDHCDVEVGVAVAGQTKLRPGEAADAADAADRCLGKTAVLQRAIGTVDAARPVGVPVVGEATAEAPSLHRFKTAIHKAIAASEYGIIDGR